MAEKNIKLTKKALKSLFYRSWFGLSYSDKPKETSSFAKEVEVLLQDVSAAKKLKAKIERINTYPSFVRFFCWLFNLESYTKDSYLLTACYLLEQEESCHMPNLLDVNFFQTHLFWALKNLGDILIEATDCCRRDQGRGNYAEISDELQRDRAEQTATSLQLPSQTSLKSEFKYVVSHGMLSFLKVLGLADKVIGTTFTLAEVKTAYHKQAMLWHPDRNLGQPDLAHTKCTAITQAMEELKKFMQEQVTQNFDPSEERCRILLAEIDEIYSNVERLLRENQAGWKRIGMLAKFIEEKDASIAKLQKENAEKLEAFSESNARIEKGIAELNQNTEKRQVEFVEEMRTLVSLFQQAGREVPAILSNELERWEKITGHTPDHSDTHAIDLASPIQGIDQKKADNNVNAPPISPRFFSQQKETTSPLPASTNNSCDP